MPVKFNTFEKLKIFSMKNRSWLLPQQGMWLCCCWQFCFFTVPSNSLCACKMCVFDNTLMCMWGKSSLSKSRGVAISQDNVNLISWHFRKSDSVTDVFTFAVTSWQICSYMVCVHMCFLFSFVCMCVSVPLIRHDALFPLAQDSPTSTSSWRGLGVRGVAGASGPWWQGGSYRGSPGGPTHPTSRGSSLSYNLPHHF